jgi:hypothetical protein
VTSLAGSLPWGWKEPRTTLLLPFWQELVPDLRYVICIRNPIEVAHSLARRNGFAPPRAIDLWMRYTSAALAYTRGRPRIFTFYGDYFGNASREIACLARFCGLTPTRFSTATQLLSAGLRHHVSGVHELFRHPEIPWAAKLLYYRLRLARILCGR